MDPTLYGILPGTTGAAAAQGTATGQHGITPMAGNGTMTDGINDVWEWLNTPFAQPMNPVTIFVLVGSILVAIMLWNLILYHIRIAAETI